MIELLFGLALASAVPLGFLIAIGLLTDGSAVRGGLVATVWLAAGLAVLALVAGRGPAAVLVVPWWLAAVGLAVASAWKLLGEVLAVRLAIAPWRVGVAVATGFLAVGATWLVLDRAAIRPFGFDRTIVLLTAVHFHVAGFALTLAGSLAARRRPGIGVHAAVLFLVAGTPLTALGFFGLPLVSWVGALLVAVAGIGIGIVTIGVARRTVDGVTSALLTMAGATLFVTMPLAAAYATGTTFGIGFLDIPAMAGIHGGLNVVGFAIPAMLGWERMRRLNGNSAGRPNWPEAVATGSRSGPVRPRDVISFNRAPFVGGPTIGLGAILAASSIDAVPAPVRIAIGLAGAAAIAMTGSALFATWRVFGPDAPARWTWIAQVGAGSTRWLNLTTGFDDSTEQLHATVPGAGSTLDVFDPDRSHEAALRTARAAFPPRGAAVPVSALATAVELGPFDVVFLLMSAHESHGAERDGLLSAARRALAPAGRVVLVEHVRDRANILAFGPGAWHFSRRDDWLRSAAVADLELVDEVALDPWVAGFVLTGRAA